MLTIGNADAFEQSYMAKFELLASAHGVFVKYERDRAARDIGLHLTKDFRSGKKVANSLVWFQMKGVMAKTLSKEAFETAGGVSLSMDVEHLRHWYLDKEPTYLVVYVESADRFLIVNLQQYIARTWGHDILTLEQKTATVTVPASSVLDEQAFAILLRQADIAQWMKALKVDQVDAELIHWGYNLIYALGTSTEREVEHSVHWTKWISKMRHELRVAERPADFDGEADDGWKFIHEHWQYGGIDPQESYPFLDFYGFGDDDPDALDDSWYENESGEDGEYYQLKNGEVVFGPNAANEFCSFVFGVNLNDYGWGLFSHVQTLIRLSLLELRDPASETRTFLSIAPWHTREV